MARAHAKNLPLSPGTRLNRYRIAKRLASGGYGVVYMGQRDDGKWVAIKEFLPLVIACRTRPKQVQVEISDQVDHDRFQAGLRAFFREADMLSRIHDERIIAIWDVFEQHGTAYFAMPLERGHTLHEMLRPDRPLGDAQLRQIFVEAAQGVEALHASGLLHLDLKPGNLWMRPEGNIVVLDLGASRWQDEEGHASSLARTPGYAAPEQHQRLRAQMGDDGKMVLHGRAEMDARTDVYGLAASMRALLEGQAPPEAPDRDPSETLRRKWLGQRQSGLLEVIDRGMAFQPAERYPSVKAFRQALQALPRVTDRGLLQDGLD